MWTGIVSRKEAEYLMGSAAVGGGFVAVDLPLDNGFLAAVPFPVRGQAMSGAEFRARLIRENSCLYLGRGEPHADDRGFASISRIANLLNVIDAGVDRG